MAVEKETRRIEAFRDGVFAVAITLLVFDLKVPQLPQGEISVEALGMALFKGWPILPYVCYEFCYDFDHVGRSP